MFQPPEGVVALRLPNFTLSIVESEPALGSNPDLGETYLYTAPSGAWTFNGLHLGTMLH
jgi:hypothetical protein